MVALIYNPDIWESMTGELSVGISLGLNGEFQASVMFTKHLKSTNQAATKPRPTT